MCFLAPWSAFLAVSLTDLFKAGMLAGEGLGGVLQALLAVAKVDGSRKCLPRERLLLVADRATLPRLRHCHRLPRVRVLRLKCSAVVARVPFVGTSYRYMGATFVSDILAVIDCIVWDWPL